MYRDGDPTETPAAEVPERGYTRAGAAGRPAATTSSGMAAGAEPSAQEREAALATIKLMLDGVDPFCVSELEQALRTKLSKPIDPVEDRLARLGFLAELQEAEGVMIGGPDDWPGVPLVPRQRYDELVPKGHHTSGALVALYGSWLKVCRSAYGLRPDGRTVGPGRPWMTSRKIRQQKHRWTTEDCLYWLRRCARELGHVPTSDDYNRWRRERVRIPGNQAVRCPWAKTITEHVGGSWAAAISRIGITDAELEQIRVARLPVLTPAPQTVADRLAALDDDKLAELGLTPTQAKKLRGKKQRHALTLSAAVELAIALEGSLDWLAGDDEEPGEPPAEDVRVNADQMKHLIRKHEIKEGDVRSAAGLALGPWRTMLAGKTEPTLGQLAAIARALRTTVGDLAG